MARDGVEPSTFRVSVGRSYQLSYLAAWSGMTGPSAWLSFCPFRRGFPAGQIDTKHLATPTGLEPATSAVTGRRANQLRYGASTYEEACTPNGVRTRVTALKGRRPRPLDDGGLLAPTTDLPLGADPA